MKHYQKYRIIDENREQSRQIRWGSHNIDANRERFTSIANEISETIDDLNNAILRYDINEIEHFNSLLNHYDKVLDGMRHSTVSRVHGEHKKVITDVAASCENVLNTYLTIICDNVDPSIVVPISLVVRKVARVASDLQHRAHPCRLQHCANGHYDDGPAYDRLENVLREFFEQSDINLQRLGYVWWQ